MKHLLLFAIFCTVFLGISSVCGAVKPQFPNTSLLVPPVINDIKGNSYGDQIKINSQNLPAPKQENSVSVNSFSVDKNKNSATNKYVLVGILIMVAIIFVSVIWILIKNKEE